MRSSYKDVHFQIWKFRVQHVGYNLDDLLDEPYSI